MFFGNKGLDAVLAEQADLVVDGTFKVIRWQYNARHVRCYTACSVHPSAVFAWPRIFTAAVVRGGGGGGPGWLSSVARQSNVGHPPLSKCTHA